MSDCPDSAPQTDDEVKQAFALLERYLPSIVDEIDRRCDEKFAHGVAVGLELAFGKDRAEAVLASLRGEDPGTAVRRHVRFRDRQTVMLNRSRLREQ